MRIVLLAGWVVTVVACAAPAGPDDVGDGDASTDAAPVPVVDGSVAAASRLDAGDEPVDDGAPVEAEASAPLDAQHEACVETPSALDFCQTTVQPYGQSWGWAAGPNCFVAPIHRVDGVVTVRPDGRMGCVDVGTSTVGSGWLCCLD